MRRVPGVVRLILVRHGDAHAGFHGPVAGRKGCAGLTPLGRRQAEALRDHLAASRRIEADVLLASELPRAIETASIIGPGLGLDLSGRDCDLCEIHTGEADGIDWSEYNARYGSFDMEAEPERPFAPGGDSWSSFHRRVAGVLARLGRDHPDQTVVAVSHAGLIIASMRLLLGITDPATSAHLRPSNTGLTEWELDPASGRWLLRGYNDAPHLLGLDAPPDRTDRAAEVLGPPAIEMGRHTVDGARRAAENDDLNDWVAGFLSSPGSDNAVLGQALTTPPRAWLGPVQLPIDQLHRLAGPPGAPVLETVSDDEWRDDVDDLAELVDDGLEPPPVIVTWSDGQLVLEDGNHRVEALRRAGHDQAWAVVGFDRAEERDRFIAHRAASA